MKMPAMVMPCGHFFGFVMMPNENGMFQRLTSKAPHPNPLPEGEGTDRDELKSYADMKYRVVLKF